MKKQITGFVCVAALSLVITPLVDGQTLPVPVAQDRLQVNNKDLKAALEAVLLPHQSKRLDRIATQVKMKSRGDTNTLVGKEMPEKLGIEDEQKRKDILYVMFFEGVSDAVPEGTAQRHVVTTRIELGKHFHTFLMNGNPQLDGEITKKDDKLAAKIDAKIGGTGGKFEGAIKKDVAFRPSGYLASGGLTSFFFIVTNDPKKHLKKHVNKQRD